MAKNIYFAADEAPRATAALLAKADSWHNNLESNGYLEKLRMCWAAYHGAYYSTVSDGHQITFSGEQGELVNLPVNHIRNLAEHILVMTTAQRPTIQARSTNTDYRSRAQAILANGLIDYYMREKRLEKFIKNAVESAIVLGSGYVKMAWNATSGEIYDYNEDTKTPIYEGDVEFSNLSPFDVVVDSCKENQNHDWVLTRSWKNRFDLVAKYPELEDKILSLPTKNEAERLKVTDMGDNSSEDVAVFEFYHRRSEALPDGRYLLFCSSEATMYDGPLPYRSIPIYRIAPSEIMGTPYGYTNIFDLLPLQEGINSLYSTVLTNNNAFGVQNILVPRNADIVFSQLSGGLNIIEANFERGKPEALNLTKSSPETFKLIEMLERNAETLSGINQVARGNPPPSLQSGSALALVQSMAIQFMSGLQQSYVQLIEDSGTALINMLRDFAAVPRIAAIAGKSNRSLMKEFMGDDLSTINRVIVDVGNPLARTVAGRVEMAQQMLQMGIIKNPQDYLMVINTGSLDSATDSVQSDLMLIQEENDRMMNGEEVPVMPTDSHMTHINEHKTILNNPDLRRDATLVNLVLNHIQQHIDDLRNLDPGMLAATGQQPLPPAIPPGPPAPPIPGGPVPPSNNPNVPPMDGNMPLSPEAEEAGINLPNTPQPPQVG